MPAGPTRAREEPPAAEAQAPVQQELCGSCPPVSAPLGCLMLRTTKVGCPCAHVLQPTGTRAS